jgi:hypothetical protein
MSNRKTTPDVLGAVLGGAAPAESAAISPTNVPPVSATPVSATPVSAPLVTDAETASATNPQKWEYREVLFRDYRGWRARAVDGVELGDWKNAPALLDYLAQAGRDGWELVSMGERHHNHKEAYFKRPKP